LIEKGVIGDTLHDPRDPDPTPEDHNNDRGRSNSHKDRGRSSNKDRGNKLGEMVQLLEER
jgi:hypothetical protein